MAGSEEGRLFSQANIAPFLQSNNLRVCCITKSRTGDNKQASGKEEMDVVGSRP